jgi:hypothetical protein
MAIVVSSARQAKKRFTRIRFSVCFFFIKKKNYTCSTTWIPLRRRAALRTRGTFIKRRYEGSCGSTTAGSCFSVLTEFDGVQSLRQQYYMRLNECYLFGSQPSSGSRDQSVGTFKIQYLQRLWRLINGG